jgi:hypothetical protein
MGLELGLSFHHRLNTFKKRAMRRIFGPKRRKENIMWIFITYNLPFYGILLC